MRRLFGPILVLVLMLVAACSEGGEAPRSASREAAPPAASPPAPDRCEHGMPPSICPKCVPALAAVYQSKGDWCPEHGVPEPVHVPFTVIGGVLVLPAVYASLTP